MKCLDYFVLRKIVYLIDLEKALIDSMFVIQ